MRQLFQDYKSCPPVSIVYLDATAAGQSEESVAGPLPSRWRRWIAKPHKRKTRLGSYQANNSLFKCPHLGALTPSQQFLQQKKISFWQGEDCFLTHFSSTRAACSACAITSTPLSLLSCCLGKRNKHKTGSAQTTALISLNELTTANLRKSTQSESLHSLKKKNKLIWPPQSPAVNFRQVSWYKRVLDSHCCLKSVLQRGNVLPLVHRGWGGHRSSCRCCVWVQEGDETRASSLVSFLRRQLCLALRRTSQGLGRRLAPPLPPRTLVRPDGGQSLAVD